MVIEGRGVPSHLHGLGRFRSDAPGGRGGLPGGDRPPTGAAAAGRARDAGEHGQLNDEWIGDRDRQSNVNSPLFAIRGEKRHAIHAHFACENRTVSSPFPLSSLCQGDMENAIQTMRHAHSEHDQPVSLPGENNGLPSFQNHSRTMATHLPPAGNSAIF